MSFIASRLLESHARGEELGGLLLVLLACTGCYTTKHVVTVAPLETRFPVSASGQYFDASGSIVGAKGYAVRQPFAFDRVVQAPRHDTTETRLSLESDLEQLVAASGGDAVTDLKIEGTSYDPGSHYSSARWSYLGWTFGLIGGAAVGVGLAEDSLRDKVIPAGAVCLGISALGFVLGAATNDPAAWTFRVSGNVVKRRDGTPAVAEIPAPTPTPAPSEVDAK